MSFKQFDKEFKAAHKKIKTNNNKVLRGVADEVFSKIIDRTTVGNPSKWKNKAPFDYTPGRLKANWIASITSPPQERRNEDRDPSGNNTKGRMRGAISRFRVGLTAYLANNQPYAASVEHGSNINRPAGMVKRTLASFKDIVIKHTNRNKI